LQNTVHIGGGAYSFEVAQGSAPPVLFLGVRKSGSSIFFSITEALCKRAKVNFVNFVERFFQSNLDESAWRFVPSLAGLIQPGNAYGGFRSAPFCIAGSPHLAQAVTMLFVRDPRDALVSEYFSNAYSHSIPQGDSGAGARKELLAKREAALAAPIDDYVLANAGALKRTYEEYREFFGGRRPRLFRYEDYIFRKEALIAEIGQAMGYTFDDHYVKLVLSWADVRPQGEDPRRFVRKVSPGDHVDKLSPACVNNLTALFRPVMKDFGYEL